MKTFIKKLLDTLGHYNLVDAAMFKFCLVSIGILLGAYFSAFFLSYIIVIWVLAVISYIWLIYKTFGKYYNK